MNSTAALASLLDRVQKDLEVYKLQVTDPTEQNIARIRLQDSLHNLHHYLEDVWGVYDAEKLYPTALVDLDDFDEEQPDYAL